MSIMPTTLPRMTAEQQRQWQEEWQRRRARLAKAVPSRGSARNLMEKNRNAPGTLCR